jgi:DHA2 family multidrug resistance protein
MALFGLTVILAPTIGPTLGGLITDNISWHWIFLINVPIAILSLFLVQTIIQEPEALQKERERQLARGLKLDVIGFAFVVIGLGALEYTMDRGEREDWFSSTTIQISAVLAVVGLIAFVVRELTAKEPLLDLRLFKNRNFAVANVVIGVVGVILFGTTQFLPQFLQQVMGYTATMTGYAMTAGGLATLIAMPLSGVLSNKLQPRWLLAFSLAIESYALWRLTHLTGSISFSYAAQMRVWIAVGIPFLFVPLSSAAYVGLPPDKSAQGAAMMSISRNLGGSMGISLVQTFLAHSQQWHQAHMVERLNPLNPAYQQGLRNIAGMLMANGASAGEAKRAAVGVLYSGVLRQAAILSYIDMFWLLTIFVGCIAPLVFFLKATPGRAGAR